MPRAAPPEDLEIFELNLGVTAQAGNRHEVTCPCRVLADSEVAGVLGFPLPGTALALAARGPSGIPSSVRVQRRDSLNDPLVGFSSSSRCCPKSPPRVSRPKAPLLGFCSLQRIRRRESTSNGVLRRSVSLPGVTRAVYRWVPTHRLRCRSQVFSTSQRLLPLSAVQPFSGGWRSWVSPYKGLFLSRSLGGSSPPTYPLDVAPLDCAIPILGGGSRGAPTVA